MTFKEKVFAVVKKIPKGGVLTYKEVAKKAGNEKASRAVGNILNTNYNPDIPCHRVVRSDGKKFPTRIIAEYHIQLEFDNYIPTLEDWVSSIKFKQKWQIVGAKALSKEYID
mgnify:CR=1 FL=1